SQQVYILLNGRWFTAPNQSGPWTYVAPSALPIDFGKIPADSPKACVRVSVSGTPENTDANGDYQLPQTAAIKAGAQIPTIEYDGSPQFEVIQGTDVEYAVNTSSDIVKAGGHYYCCSDGVWYVSDIAAGPFTVTSEIPPSIYLIPPANPLYYVTFVRAFNAE